jgi:hypothetical protein
MNKFPDSFTSVKQSSKVNVLYQHVPHCINFPLKVKG